MYQLNSHRGLRVGECVPFYFWPRSIMLYVIHMANSPELDYRGGQGPIVHLERPTSTRRWIGPSGTGQRWAFTLSNAGSRYFQDRCDRAQLDELDWAAIQARDWRACKEGKAGGVPVGAIVPMGAGAARWRMLAGHSRRDTGCLAVS